MAKMKTGEGADQVMAFVQEKGKPRDGAADGDCALESVGGHDRQSSGNGHPAPAKGVSTNR
jgi:hypothetical protein